MMPSSPLISFFYVMLGLCVSLSLSLPLFGQEKELKRRFLEEAPPRWNQYSERAKRFQGSMVELITVTGKSGSTVTKYEWEIKQSNGCMLLIEQWHLVDDKPSTGGWSRAFNPNYGFVLHRRNASAPWAVTRYSADLKASAFQAVAERVGIFTTCPYTFSFVFSELGTNIFEEEGLTLEKISSEFYDGRELVKVEFKYYPRKKNPMRYSLREGSVYFDPNRFWVIDKFALQCDLPRSEKRSMRRSLIGQYEYKLASGGLPIPKRVQLNWTIDEEAVVGQVEYDFSFREDSVSESECTLSAFGFPEPFGTPTPPSRWYLWAGGAGLLTLALGFILIRLRQTTAAK